MESILRPAIKRTRGTVFPTLTPLYAIESFVRRITAPAAHRGWRRPLELMQARRDVHNDESAEAHARLLTLDPDLLMKADPGTPALVQSFYSRLGRHREMLITAQTPRDRDVARRWISTALLSSSVDPETFSLPNEELVDRATCGDAAAWNALIHLRPAAILLPAMPGEQASDTLGYQVLIRIARRIAEFTATQRGSAHTAARTWLTKVFLRVDGKRRGNALDHRSIGAVYQMCLDWLVHFDRERHRMEGPVSTYAIGEAHGRWQAEANYARNRLPKTILMRILRRPNKEGACVLAGYLLGCSAERVRRSKLHRVIADVVLPTK